METIRVLNGNDPMYFRTWDHQLMQQLRIVRAREKPGPDAKWDLLETVRRVPQNVADVASIYGTKEQIGCNLGEF